MHALFIAATRIGNAAPSTGLLDHPLRNHPLGHARASASGIAALA
jgi:hypothetical protein